MTVTVLVGFAIARPPSPANIRFSTITLDDMPSEVEASLRAAQWVADRPGVVMPTSTQVLAVTNL